MIIDFHVHCFPDALAKRAIHELAERANLYPHSNGTINGTVKHIKDSGVDKFVLLNIATKPKQQRTINDWAISLINDDTVIPFGSIHPFCDDKIEELKRLHNAGIRGIKIHPDYQNFFVDDPCMDCVYEECGKLGMIISFHAGVDLGLSQIVHATPTMIAKAVKKHPGTTFIAAHMGGYWHWDEVLEQLCGINNLYLDTAYCGVTMPVKKAEEIIAAHGADRILMASDMPWEIPSESIKMIKSLNISESDKINIMGGNAEKLLNLI
ncbi:MAG: hypothetical protein A2Y17_08580 [Clostridiales bacterium GWF2_38_85]|nr:MAG: hypothetical protein A2Y17_08580 [Clostridiales bacterium GWF2_38_85]HBL83750.1 amidohydrolase [Clostridiales bacterium]